MAKGPESSNVVVSEKIEQLRRERELGKRAQLLVNLAQAISLARNDMAPGDTTELMYVAQFIDGTLGSEGGNFTNFQNQIYAATSPTLFKDLVEQVERLEKSIKSKTYKGMFTSNLPFLRKHLSEQEVRQLETLLSRKKK